MSGAIPTALWDAQATRKVAGVLRGAIDARAFVRGHGIDDGPLAPYSSGYAAKLKAAGESTRVDLNRSGRLRAAVAGSLIEATSAGAVLGIRGPEAAVAGTVNAARPFWGVSPSDRLALGEAVRAQVLRVMRR